jgi:hypothetical protein
MSSVEALRPEQSEVVALIEAQIEEGHGTREHLKELVTMLAESNTYNPGVIEGINGAQYTLEQVHTMIDNGDATNISHGAIQRGFRLVEATESVSDKLKYFNGTREQLAELVREMGRQNQAYPGMISGGPSGNISAERAAQAVLEGYGENVSDPDIQVAARRVYDAEQGGVR